MRFARRTMSRRRGYVLGYLRSIAWFRRRDQWFEDEVARHGLVRCIVCRKAGSRRTFELHHLEYTGVTQDARSEWIAGERHEDLVAAHPRCHEWIHTLLDRDEAASAAVDRRAANVRVIRGLRAKFATAITQLGEDDGL